MKRSEAIAYRRKIEAAAETQTDEQALESMELFPKWRSRLESGEKCKLNERLWYDGKLWKVITEHTPQADWTPDTAVSLFTEVSIEEWPEWRQPTGSHDAYMAGDKVTYDNRHWINEVDYNTYAPGVYGWKEQV